MVTTDSDSSEDENTAHLREAVDTQFITDAMYKNKSKEDNCDKKEPQETELPKSLRNTKCEEDEQFNSLGVTPQFQNYVAKQLSKLLDESLIKKIKDYSSIDESPKKKRKKGGVKLFSDSPKFLKITKENKTATIQNVRIKKCDTIDEDENKFLEAAVKPERVLSKIDTLHWAERYKKRIVKYAKQKNGQLCIIDPIK